MQRPAIDRDGRSDVIVLGGGIIGASIARELSREGVVVQLVDAGTVGAGTSGRCDGNLLVQTKHDDLGIELMLQSLRRYREWAAALDLDIRFDQPGSLVFFTSHEETPAARERVKRLTHLGVRADLLTAEQVHSRQPGLGHQVTAGIDCYDDATAYPPAVVAALVADAQAHGCRVRPSTPARRLLVDGTGRTRGVQTDAGELTAPWVVNAMGVWSAELDVGGAVDLPVRPRQGVLAVTDRAPGVVERAVTEASYMTNRASGGDGSTAQVSFVAEPTYAGNILLGSSRRFCGYDTRVRQDILTEIVTRARSLMPALSRLRIIRSFAGLRPWSPDNLPIVGESARTPGYVLATGHEGEGIGYAPLTADIIHRQILGEPADDLLARAMNAWSPSRLESLRAVGSRR